MSPQEIQALLKRLSLRSDALGAAVAEGLRTLDPSVEAVRGLRERLTSSDQDRREAAAHALRHLGRKGVEALIDAARKEIDGAGRAAAVGALGDSGGRGCFITGAPYGDLGVDPSPTLWDCLSDSHADVRAAAIEGLAELCPRSPRLIEHAAAMARDSDPRVRSKAAWLLGRERTLSPSQIDALASLLHDPAAQVRFEAACAMAGLEVEQELVCSLLRAGLDYPDERIRHASASRLRFYPAQAVELAPALAARLADEDPQVARAALQTLGAFGPPAAAAAPAIDALFRRREFIGDCAAALAGLGPAGIQALAKRLADPEEEIRYQVLIAVGSCGADARPAMGGLLLCLDDRVARVRFRAAQAVLKVDPSQATTIISRIREASPFDRSHLAWYLAEIGAPADDVFRRLAEDPDPRLRELAARRRP
jgi:HEAT repeat protein